MKINIKKKILIQSKFYLNKTILKFQLMFNVLIRNC